MSSLPSLGRKHLFQESHSILSLTGPNWVMCSLVVRGWKGDYLGGEEDLHVAVCHMPLAMEVVNQPKGMSPLSIPVHSPGGCYQSILQFMLVSTSVCGVVRKKHLIEFYT